VTILERDRLPEQPEPRAGVPQARHVHLRAGDDNGCHRCGGADGVPGRAGSAPS
jgi:hypothetical protein